MTNILNIVTEKAFNEALDTRNSVLAVLASNSGGISVKSWKDVQRIVRLGLADKIFSIGDQLECNKGDTTLVWDIIGFDHDIPVDSQFKHSMTIQLHDVFPVGMQFDANEAMFYCETELAAGTYNFTLPKIELNYGGGKTYQFTLTKSVPSGGQILFPWHKNKQASTVLISTYESKIIKTALESVGVTEGAEGTALENIGECNYVYRFMYGSNRYSTSAIRQFLNSKGEAGTVWTPQTNFDRPPSWSDSISGFLSDIDEDFLSVVGEVTKRTALLAIDGGGYEDTVETFFIPSCSEVCAGVNNKTEEGTPYAYYSVNSVLTSAGASSDSNRIKNKTNGSSCIWWLRSLDNIYGQSIGASGAMHVGSVTSQYYVSPACNII